MTNTVLPQQDTASKVGHIPTSALADLSFRLQRAGQETRSGNGWLSTLAVIAMTVSTWLALVVAGGTMMFYRRSLVPPPPLPENPTPQDYAMQDNGDLYLQLAFIACVFVVPAMMGLVAQSAVLGAAGREGRLATLRLIGLSNGAVTRMTLVEILIQAGIGIAFGTVLSVSTAPFWALVSFDNDYLGTWDMLLPWWGYPAVWAIVLVLALAAALVGLKRVLVSPLGVSRREIPGAVKRWRLVVFIVLFVVTVVFINSLDVKSINVAATAYAAFAMLVIFSAVNIVAPFIVQLVARLSAPLGTASDFVATRRVATNAKESWRRVSAMTFLSLLLGYIAVIPKLEMAEDLIGATFANDIVVGIIITFIIGFTLLMVSTVLTQASAVYEQAALTKALDYIGAPVAFHRRAAFKQTFFPLFFTSFLAFLMGCFFGLILFGSAAEANPVSSRTVLVVSGYILAVILVGVATLAVDPLRRKLLNRQVRRND
ncbi:FtsX-like permease family protein [Corynebacterium lactis]|uniref:ABC3 transporter permease C-terminal domain-containing protein n=1 Tax=Corynebacterium lactis RW2-5 TaxID=1408189 RepID=A0A0K2H4F0_9CORY|nr:FtsX-like permease family protein [Corynebacterium lactis]ALA68591.1 hypothetical protein CLAC_08410 [Corynebacterium lactis RW2-5]